jgi:hypothetical protein
VTFGLVKWTAWQSSTSLDWISFGLIVSAFIHAWWKNCWLTKSSEWVEVKVVLWIVHSYQKLNFLNYYYYGFIKM